MTRPMGLIAGEGRLPILEAQGMRRAGHWVGGLGFVGAYDPTLPGECDAFAEVGLARPTQWTRRLRGWGCREAVMVGYVAKSRMYEPLGVKIRRMLPDLPGLALWYRTFAHDRRSQTLLAGLADVVGQRGVCLIDTTRHIPEHLPQAGLIGSRWPSAAVQRDIEFGWPILLRMNALDIGQAVAVKDREVIAVEAMEGTDRMIERAGRLCPTGGWTLLKGCGPDKDMRFDVPTVGLQTIARLKQAKARCLALAANRVILVDKDALIPAADEARIALVGVEGEGAVLSR